MNAGFAPIIHARTRDVDFRSRLLVIPDDFSDADIQWARKYITDSTRYFELVGAEGRRVIFCNRSYIVQGISIMIRDLYRVCGRKPQYEIVDGGRENYAFIGVVAHRGELTHPVDIPQSWFLEKFQEYMNLRWSDPVGPAASLEPTRVSYAPAKFPQSRDIYDGPIDAGQGKAVLHTGTVPLDALLARVQKMIIKGDDVSFCSDLPNASSIVQSDFVIATSPGANSIQAVISQKPQPKTDRSDTGPARARPAHSTVTDIDRLRNLGVEDNEHPGQPGSIAGKLLVLGTILGAVVALAGVIGRNIAICGGGVLFVLICVIGRFAWGSGKMK